MSPRKPTREQLGLRVGDLVEVTKDDGSTEQHHVKIEPWQLGHGEYVVGLHGISGGYKLTRCVLKSQ
jgi:bifunctional DNA-binding transcriptional regulator/antitoxin component of YhaV-PrlF toxin-antitoxin module